jgi:hypothetical protein
MAGYWLPRSLGRGSGTALGSAGLWARGTKGGTNGEAANCIETSLGCRVESSSFRGSMSKEVADPGASLLPLQHDNTLEANEGDDQRRRELMTKVLQHTLVVLLDLQLFDLTKEFLKEKAPTRNPEAERLLFSPLTFPCVRDSLLVGLVGLGTGVVGGSVWRRNDSTS